jgi:hypothetical protein
MGHKAHVGDVFLIPVDSTRFGVGQIAGDWKGELYVVIYDKILSGDKPEPECVSGAKPLFAALSMDAKIHHGDWPIIGNVTGNLEHIPQPVFKVDQGGKVFLESRDRSISRPASSSEAERLKLRTVVAPVRLENAFKAHNGVGEWHPRYDELRAEYAFDSSRVLAA